MIAWYIVPLADIVYLMSVQGRILLMSSFPFYYMGLQAGLLYVIVNEFTSIR